MVNFAISPLLLPYLYKTVYGRFFFAEMLDLLLLRGTNCLTKNDLMKLTLCTY